MFFDNKTPLFLALLAMFLAPSSAVLAANIKSNICNYVLSNETQLLDQFETVLAKNEITEIKLLQSRILEDEASVFLLKTAVSDSPTPPISYVIRLGVDHQNIEYEIFANQFIKNSNSVVAPKVRKVKDIKALQKLLKSKLPDSMDFSKASVAMYLPAKNAFKFVEKNTRSYVLRTKLIEVIKSAASVNSIFYGPKALDLAIENFYNLLDKTPEENRKYFFNELQKFFPELPDSSLQWVVYFATKLRSLLLTKDKEKIQKFYEFYSKIWFELDPKIRKDIANAWTLMTVLGINDFFDINWRAHKSKKSQIIAYDQASMSVQFENGVTELVSLEQEFPLGGAIMIATDIEMLKQDVDEEIKNYLKSITKESLLENAKNANFEINQTQIDGMLGRIKEILK